MRKILRSIARGRMERRGFVRINKRRGLKSFFAKNWRDYINR